MSYKDDGNGASESSLSTYKVLRVGDIAFEGHTNKQFRFGRFVVNDIGTGIMSPRFSTLRPLNEMPVNFWKQYIHSESVMRRILVNSTKAGTMMNELVIPEFLNQTIMVPSENEQAVIGQYFTNLDHIITLHQRKCDEAKKLKKCMLQKMFPKDGEKVPEIRFSGFTSDWKQRKLEEIVNRITRKNSKLISELPLTISAQQGLIDQNEFFDKRVASKDVSGYYLIKNGEFAYNKSTSNDAPWGAIKRLDRYENGVLSTLYIVFEIKDETLVNSDFLVAYYSTNLWHKGIHEIAAEGARNHGLLNIAPTDFFKTKLKLPADIEEQKEIGEYFKKIDLLITFHHRKLNIINKICRYAWEQRKLSDIYGSIGNAFVGTATPYYAEQGHFYLESNNVKDGQINHNSEVFINDEFYEKQKDKWLHTGDMVMVQSGHVGHAAVISEELDNTAAHALIMFRNPKEEIEPYFLNYEYQTDKAKKKIENITTGNTIKHILASDMQEFVVDVPKYEEQKVIADYFRNLDHFITLHQQKCKQLQIIRKFMLQNIFL